MLAPRLRPGDCIGLASPSWLGDRELFAKIFAAIEGMGYRAKAANNLYAAGWGYAASDRERADDINQLILDDEVKMIFFSGGEGAEDVLPLVDFEAARAHPKLWMSYSDGTTLTNAVWAKTGLVTYYGQSPHDWPALSAYDRAQFEAHMVRGGVKRHAPSGPWRLLCPGKAAGTLTGGFVDNYIFLMNNGWVAPKPGEDYLLFLEDNECFWPIEHESALLARVEQSPLMPQVRGLLFGHYSDGPAERLMERLTRLGRKWNIPVAYCDDFGHGTYHAILPIGARAALDADRGELTYPD